MKVTTPSNSGAILFEMAEQASRLYRQSTENALACGRVLVKARKIAAHGAWLSFLNDTGIAPRTAQRLMRVAEYAGEDEAKCAAVAHLGIRRTDEFLAACDHAMAAWRAARDAEPGNDQLIQKLPDGPLSTLYWLDEPRDIAAMLAFTEHAFGVSVEEVLESWREAVEADP